MQTNLCDKKQVSDYLGMVEGRYGPQNGTKKMAPLEIIEMSCIISVYIWQNSPSCMLKMHELIVCNYTSMNFLN